LMNKYNIPLELWLAQAVIESNIWTSGWRPTKTKNIFNVGNVDDWSDKYMKTREEWVENYAKLLKEKYSNNEWVVDTQYLIKNWFKNKNWNKYASDSNYIEKLSKTIISINEIIA
jgi:flagellum-specific peptidoglycan hydrolase FlgJ